MPWGGSAHSAGNGNLLMQGEAWIQGGVVHQVAKAAQAHWLDRGELLRLIIMRGSQVGGEG